MSSPRRDEVWLVAPDPVIGAEIRKTRPCVVISPDEMNEALLTVMVAPMTSTIRPYPFRVNLSFKGTAGQVALDQARAVSVQRMVRRLGLLRPAAAQSISDVLMEMFSR